MKVARDEAREIQASRVLSKLSKCFISRWWHGWHINQSFENIFNAVIWMFYQAKLLCFNPYTRINRLRNEKWGKLAQQNLITRIWTRLSNRLFTISWQVKYWPLSDNLSTKRDIYSCHDRLHHTCSGEEYPNFLKSLADLNFICVTMENDRDFIPKGNLRCSVAYSC